MHLLEISWNADPHKVYEHMWERLTDDVWNDIEWVKAARSKPAHPLMLLHILVAKA